jgi:hypothetical protein
MQSRRACQMPRMSLSRQYVPKPRGPSKVRNGHVGGLRARRSRTARCALMTRGTFSSSRCLPWPSVPWETKSWCRSWVSAIATSRSVRPASGPNRRDSTSPTSSTQGCPHPSPPLKNAVSSTPTPVVILHDIVGRRRRGHQRPYAQGPFVAFLAAARARTRWTVWPKQPPAVLRQPVRLPASSLVVAVHGWSTAPRAQARGSGHA